MSTVVDRSRRAFVRPLGAATIVVKIEGETNMPDHRRLPSVVAVIGIALAGAAQAETLTVQTSFNKGAFAVEYLMAHWAPKLLEMTGGDIGIDIVPSDTVVPYRETPEAVAAGVLDGDHTSIAYFSNRE